MLIDGNELKDFVQCIPTESGIPMPCSEEFIKGIKYFQSRLLKEIDSARLSSSMPVGWISVNYSVPEDKEPVLVADEKGNIRMAYFMSGMFSRVGVQYWMGLNSLPPLPSAPNADGGRDG